MIQVVIRTDTTQFKEEELKKLLQRNKDHIKEYRYKGKYLYIVFIIDKM